MRFLPMEYVQNPTAMAMVAIKGYLHEKWHERYQGERAGQLIRHAG